MPLDPTQQKVIEHMAKKNPKNFFLSGPSGSGKTLLLTEVLKMKLSMCRKEQKVVSVIISVFGAPSDQTLLMRNLQQKYLPNISSLVNAVNLIAAKDLCTSLGIE